MLPVPTDLTATQTSSDPVGFPAMVGTCDCVRDEAVVAKNASEAGTFLIEQALALKLCVPIRPGRCW